MLPPIDSDLLRSAVNAAANGLLLVDADGTIVFANRQAEVIFGHAAGGLTNTALSTLIPASVRGGHRAYQDAYLSDPAPRMMGKGRDLGGLHRDGHEVPLEIGLNSIDHPTGRYVLASIVDLTERRRAEASVRWLSLAVEQGPTSVVMTDMAGNIEYVNAKFTEVTGYTLDDVRGKNPRILKSGETPAAVYRDLWATINAGRQWHGEVLNRKKDGTTYWDAMWVYPIRDRAGAVTRFLAIKEDISERKHTEQARKEREDYYRTILENIGDAVFIADATGRYRDVNPRACEVTGYSREELLELEVMDTYPEDDREAGRRRMLEVGRGEPAVFERRLRRKDGSLRAVEVNAHVLPDGRLLGTMRDITDRSKLETQLRQAQKMEAIGRLAGGIAHDFNNILTAVFGYVDLLREELPANSDAQEDLAEVRKAAERAAGLTRQLLAFSRQQVLEPVVLRLNDLVEDFEKMLRRVIGEDVELRLALGEHVGNVLTDPGQLNQVIMNLVVNARDAMPTGGKLTIETASVDLTEEYAELHQPITPGPYVMLAVSDTGAGMTPEVRARIFEPFFTTKDKSKGTGLGLSTVYGIVKQSGGYIWAYSEPGRGTTFKIYLPRKDAAATSLAKPKDAVRLTGSETILIAEDDSTLRPLARELLEKLGYKVLDGEDAETALAAAEAHQGPIHLLIADVVMPKQSGRDLARRLAETRPDTKVLYVSGYTDDAIVHHGMLEPGLNFLHKPFTPSVLASKVRHVLDAK